MTFDALFAAPPPWKAAKRCGSARPKRGEHKRFTHHAREVVSYLGLLSVVQGFAQKTSSLHTTCQTYSRRSVGLPGPMWEAEGL